MAGRRRRYPLGATHRSERHTHLSDKIALCRSWLAAPSGLASGRQSYPDRFEFSDSFSFLSLANEHLLLRIVEGDTSSRMQRGNRHADRRRVVVACMNIRIGCFATAHTLHPIAHMR